MDFAEETVSISVSRNVHAPEFTEINYFVQLNETEPVGSLILTITATDDDAGVSNCLFYVLGSE